MKYTLNSGHYTNRKWTFLSQFQPTTDNWLEISNFILDRQYRRVQLKYTSETQNIIKNILAWNKKRFDRKVQIFIWPTSCIRLGMAVNTWPEKLNMFVCICAFCKYIYSRFIKSHGSHFAEYTIYNFWLLRIQMENTNTGFQISTINPIKQNIFYWNKTKNNFILD